MRILMMTNTYFPIVGGLEQSIKTFSEEFRKLGHKVKIVSPDFKDLPKNEPNIIRLPAVRNFNKTDFSLHIPMPGLLEKLYESYRPDVVHAHHPFLVGDIALRFCGQYDIPLIFTYHTMFEQYTDYFSLDKESVRAFVMKLAAGYANLVDQVIVPSQSIGKILTARGVKSPINVVPTGFDVSKFATGSGKAVRKQLEIPQEAFLVGHLGRLSKEKNLDFLTQAIAVFLVQNPKVYFLVVGKGDSRKEMEQTFKTCGVLERVKFAGVLKDQEVIDAYHAMDIFAFASLSETQGMVVTEAMSAGVPVIGLDAPGVREAIQNRKSGYLIKEPHIALYVKALNDFLKLSLEKKKKFSKQARERAALFSAEKCARKAIKVYETAILNNRKQNADPEPWEMIMKRIRTEWEMFSNISQATGEAIKETIEKE